MTFNSHTIDIILCTANRDSAGLLRSLQSIQESTCKDIRVLLVNDSANPLPANLPCGTINIRILDIGANVGLTLALKAAEPFLTAHWVARMDCGDSMSPDRLERQRDFLLSNPNCVLVGARSKFLVHNGSSVQHLGFSASSEDIADLGQYLLWRNPFVHGSIMFRLTDFMAVGGYDPRFAIAQDFNLYMRMRMLGKLYILPDVLYTHIFNLIGSNTVKKNKASLASSLRSRITLSTAKERVTPMFLIGVLRDLLLLMLPAQFLAWMRFGRHLSGDKRDTH
jgi:glycosyltransferase involved in cell wall biosynthesis